MDSVSILMLLCVLFGYVLGIKTIEDNETED